MARSRTRTGRIIHFRVNPPRVPVRCKLCGRITMQQASEDYTYCSESCRRIWLTYMHNVWAYRARNSSAASKTTTA